MRSFDPGIPLVPEGDDGGGSITALFLAHLFHGEGVAPLGPFPPNHGVALGR